MSFSSPEREAGKYGAELFQTTHWSVVVRAGQQASLESGEALERLCRTYWFPLYAYIRRRGYEAAEAQDLTQDFFVRLLEKDYIARADRHKVSPPVRT